MLVWEKFGAFCTKQDFACGPSPSAVWTVLHNISNPLFLVPFPFSIRSSVNVPLARDGEMALNHPYVFFYLPRTGTDDAVGGAASTKMSSKTRKLANMLIAEIKEIAHWSLFQHTSLKCRSGKKVLFFLFFFLSRKSMHTHTKLSEHIKKSSIISHHLFFH